MYRLTRQYHFSKLVDPLVFVYFLSLFLIEASSFDKLPSMCKITYPDVDNILQFTLTITPDEVSKIDVYAFGFIIK